MGASTGGIAGSSERRVSDGRYKEEANAAADVWISRAGRAMNTQPISDAAGGAFRRTRSKHEER